VVVFVLAAEELNDIFGDINLLNVRIIVTKCNVLLSFSLC